MLDIELADLDTEKSWPCLKFKSNHELILLRDDFALEIEAVHSTIQLESG